MRKHYSILLLLTVIFIATAASAAWIPITGDAVPISSLQDGSLIFGDKKLSDITVVGIGIGGAIAPSPNSVLVQGGQDSTTGDYGLWFVLSGNAFSNQTINATLNFKISILPGYDNYFIKDVGMDITGVSANGTGGVNIGEMVWDNYPGGNRLALLSCSKQATDNDAYLTDHAEFAPLKEIWIWSKDISITGGTNGAAHLSGFCQYYSQTEVPEPATIGLLCLGGLTILGKKKHS